MRDLELMLNGADAEDAARDLAAALDDTDLELAARPLGDEDGARRKAVDPVAVAALVLAIPGAWLAALDLADRIKKRRRAKKLIEAAGRIRVERRVEILTVTAEGHRPLAELDPDALLDLVDKELKGKTHS